MSYAMNNAFEGQHEAPNGEAFIVRYRTKADLADFNKRTPPGHARYLTVGWYWWHFNLVGPFTSSRKAYRDAMAALAKSEAA